jgi:trehalose 6-phosphate synthase/phosphatase
MHSRSLRRPANRRAADVATHDGTDPHSISSTPSRSRSRLVVVSNRLPFVFSRNTDGSWTAKSGSGGLVSALLPVLRNRGGTWIGWTGTAEHGDDLDHALQSASGSAGCTLRSIQLTADEEHNFYRGFANEVIWPLFHDMQSLCNFEPEYWRVYGEVNRKFARAVMDASAADDFVWVHDYHLMNVAAELRRMGCRSRIGFFLHIPFPPPDLYLKLPWRRELILALLQYDMVGFQTLRDRRNFLDCVRALIPDVRVHGKGHVLEAFVQGRTVRVGAFPISIDFNYYMGHAATPEVAAKAKELHTLLPRRRLVLGIDRLDFTKGIPHKLKAFHSLLTRYPELQEKVSLIQVVVPSRTGIREYDELRLTIEQLVGRINGQFVRPGGWVPVWYVYSSLSPTDLLAYYRAADIALITPLRDGMNLVAKEYCASSIEEDCVLILSEFAGAAHQLRRGALLVNPHDIEGVAESIRQAYEMSLEERQARMRRLRRSIRTADIFVWVESFLAATFAKNLDDFPVPASSLPSNPDRVAHA